MRSYGEYCPISRASEILAERWVPIVVRNLLLGATTFTQVLDGAPGMSRTLLTQRLRDLERANVIDISPNPRGRGSVYELTAAGRDLWDVMIAMGNWAARWHDITHEHADPRAVLWAWSNHFLVKELLPDERVLVRFDFPDQPASRRTFWLLLDRREGEVCYKHPGYEETLVVRASSVAFAKWHAGAIEWEEAVDAGDIEVSGPPNLVYALPSWNSRSSFADIEAAARTTV